MGDILSFRENLDQVRDSERRRDGGTLKPETNDIINEIVRLDNEWRSGTDKRDNLRKQKNANSKAVNTRRQAKQDFQDLIAANRAINEEIKTVEALRDENAKKLVRKMRQIGNFVPPSVPVSHNEDDNVVVKSWGRCRPPNGKKLHHHQLLHMLDGYESARAVKVSGHRAYFLRGVGVLLNQALLNYGLSFLMKKGYTPLQPPFFMNKDVMAKTAQLEQFDEELYKVTATRKSDDGKSVLDEKYLIATSEQPISALHQSEWLGNDSLPIRYGGVSSCFRKEAGSHGKDVWGIFRIHQFEKIEQFCITSPEKSWEMHEEMRATAEEFYQSLGLSYRVVNIVSGELNNAAAKKYDLEAWFPTLGVFRELVSCSNCTDYQSRAMETRYGQKKMGQSKKEYVHMLNATLTATERTICCILENYQTDEGVLVPNALRPFMGGMKIMPFVKELPKNVGQHKAAKAHAKKQNAKKQNAKKQKQKGKSGSKKGKSGSKKGKSGSKKGKKGKHNSKKAQKKQKA